MKLKLGWNRASCTPDTLCPGVLFFSALYKGNMELTRSYKIFISQNASPTVKYAAEELRKYLNLICKFLDLDIIYNSVPSSVPEIVVGSTFRTCPTVKINNASDSVYISVENGSIYLCGGSERAVIYAVYRFLEYIGCRFFSSDTEKIPSLDSIVIDDSLEIAEGSPFEYRDIYCSCAFDTALSLKWKLNGTCKNPKGIGRSIPSYMGGGVEYAGPYFVHTFSVLVPPGEYFESHPEYFSEIDGVRTSKHLYSQLCMTNPDVVDIAAEKAKSWLRENPECKIVSVSQNDSFILKSYCQCPECSRIIEKEGAASGALIGFVNSVAEKIEEEFPNVTVDTLAYQYSVKPPKYIKPRENVCVRLCTGACFSHTIESCENNLPVKIALKEWSSICNKLYIWDYSTNFAQYLTPFPDFDAKAQNIKLFKDSNVKGVFIQGQYNGGNSGEFGELRSYLLSRALWNPDTDWRKEAAEFIDCYYGGASPYIKEYLKFIHQKIKSAHLCCAASCKDIWSELISDSELDYLDVLWSSAKSSAQSGEHPENSLLHTRRSSMCHEWFKLDSRRKEYSDGQTYEKLKEKFYEECRLLGIQKLSEGVGIPDCNPR